MPLSLYRNQLKIAMAKKEEYKEKNLQFMSEMAGQDGVSELPCGVLYQEIE